MVYWYTVFFGEVTRLIPRRNWIQQAATSLSESQVSTWYWIYSQQQASQLVISRFGKRSSRKYHGVPIFKMCLTFTLSRSSLAPNGLPPLGLPWTQARPPAPAGAQRPKRRWRDAGALLLGFDDVLIAEIMKRWIDLWLFEGNSRGNHDVLHLFTN